MATEELKNTAVATAVMAVLTLIVVYLQFTNLFLFDPIFEFCMFIMPLVLLVGYLVIQRFKRSAEPITKP